MLSTWIENQRALLKLELNEEIEQLKQKINQLSAKECEKQGLSLLHLNIVGSKNSLFGRFAISLESSRIKNNVIDRVCFKIGDEVVLYSEKKPSTVTQGAKLNENFDQQAMIINGIVSKISNEIVEIVTEESPEEVYLSPPLRLDLRSNEYTHKKMMHLLNDLESTCHSRMNGHHLVPVLFDEIDISPSNLKSNTAESCGVLMNPLLNASQIDAIRGCIGSAYVSLIHGPPGTGKTSTVTELIFQLVRLGKKVLVCAPSNVAVDNILEKIANCMNRPNPLFIDQNVKCTSYDDLILPACLRLGHPARLSDSILKFCLDSQIANHEGTEITSDIRDEINDYRKKLLSNKKGSRSLKTAGVEAVPSSYKEIRKEIKMLQKDLRKRETDIVRNIIKKKNVILCTNIGAGSKLLRDTEFDVTIIDECAQGLEASCWIPILRGSKCILAGDHLQLPPTIKCKEAEQNGLSVTLFERLIYHKRKQFESVTFLLNTQYRMNNKICSWASENMYKGLLLSHESVFNHTLDDFHLSLSSDWHLQTNVAASNIAISDDEMPAHLNLPVMLLIDTAGSAPEDTDMEVGSKASSTTRGSGTIASITSVSHYNLREAYLVLRYVKMLIRSGVKCKDIGIITPYSNQVQLLKKLFFCKTTDTTGLDSDSDGETVHKNNTSNATSLYENPIHISASSGKDEYNFDNLEIRTVDGFQGGEKEVILLSLVRSNSPRKEVGFLSDRRRMNVAVTRAKRHLAVICDVNTCSSDSFISTLLAHIATHGDSRYAEEFVHATDEELFSVEYYENSDNDRSVRLVDDSKITKSSEDLKQDMLTNIEDVVLSLASLKDGGTVSRKASKLGPTAVQFFDYSYSTDSYTSITYDKLPSLAKAEGQLVVRFPTCLNSHDRLMVHEQCDVHGIYHRSKDSRNGKKRYVEISLEPFNNEPTLAQSTTTATAVLAIAESPSYPATPSTVAEVVTSVKVQQEVEDDANNDDEDLEEECTLNDTEPAAQAVAVSQTGETKKSNHKSKPKKSQRSIQLASASVQSDWFSSGSNVSSNKSKITVGGGASGGMKNVTYYVSEERKKAMADADALVRGLDVHAFDDDDELLNAAIQTNKMAESVNKYRISSAPMPNNDKIKTQAKLKDAILDAKKNRLSEHVKQQQELAQVSTSNNRPSNKKVLKKPTPEELLKIREINSSSK